MTILIVKYLRSYNKILLLITRVIMPMEKAAKSTAFEPLMMDVEAAFLQGTAGGAD